MSPRTVPDDLQAVKFVGPATAAVLESAGISAADVVERRVSHAQLVQVGVNPGVAARIRREHSLAWSMSGGEDLDRRAEQVRGLQDDERAWVAASAGSWESESAPEQATTDGRGSDEDAETAWQRSSWPDQDESEVQDAGEIEWREASTPEPVTAISEISDGDAAALADAGITSIRSLATADPERVADSLGLDEARVRRWRNAARTMAE